jgi:autotransporter adhesin
MVGGAILLSKQDKNGEQKWVTGVTSDGISASLISTGTLNAGIINVVSGNEPVFKWDEHGITAYDYLNYSDTNVQDVISGVNTRKFVRFDKNGFYGVNDNFIDGAIWVPQNVKEISEKATFALTWDGLKVTNHNKVTMHIGDNAKADTDDTSLLLVTDEYGEPLVKIDEWGALTWSSRTDPFK